MINLTGNLTIWQGTNLEWVFVGGDIGGVAETTVESVNDGKVCSQRNGPLFFQSYKCLLYVFYHLTFNLLQLRFFSQESCGGTSL